MSARIKSKGWTLFVLLEGYVARWCFASWHTSYLNYSTNSLENKEGDMNFRIENEGCPRQQWRSQIWDTKYLFLY